MCNNVCNSVFNRVCNSVFNSVFNRVCNIVCNIILCNSALYIRYNVYSGLYTLYCNTTQQ